MRKASLNILVAMLAASCTYISPEALPDGPGATLQISFDGITPESKTQSQQETSVARLQAAIYNDRGELEWQQTYENAFSVAKTVTGLEEGRKTVVALANKAIDMPRRLEDFHRIPTSLSDNRRGAFVMVGSAEAEAGVKPGEVTVMLRRLAAKITVRSAILLDWTGTPPDDFGIEAIWIANAGCESDLSGSGEAAPALNTRSTGEVSTDETLRDLTYAARTSWKGTGDVFNNGVDFYVYPNATSVRTTLVIQTRFNGHTSYYPLVIDRDVESNTQYRCGTVTLTCDGMASPAEDFTSIKVIYRYAAEDWKMESIGDAVSF